MSLDGLWLSICDRSFFFFFFFHQLSQAGWNFNLVLVRPVCNWSSSQHDSNPGSSSSYSNLWVGESWAWLLLLLLSVGSSSLLSSLLQTTCLQCLFNLSSEAFSKAGDQWVPRSLCKHPSFYLMSITRRQNIVQQKLVLVRIGSHFCEWIPFPWRLLPDHRFVANPNGGTKTPACHWRSCCCSSCCRCSSPAGRCWCKCII